MLEFLFDKVGLKACIFVTSRLQHKIEIFKNTYFEEHRRTVASVNFLEKRYGFCCFALLKFRGH